MTKPISGSYQKVPSLHIQSRHPQDVDVLAALVLEHINNFLKFDWVDSQFVFLCCWVLFKIWSPSLQDFVFHIIFEYVVVDNGKGLNLKRIKSDPNLDGHFKLLQGVNRSKLISSTNLVVVPIRGPRDGPGLPRKGRGRTKTAVPQIGSYINDIFW